LQIQLTWIDPNTDERRQALLEIPVAIGSELTKMPQQNDGKRVSRIVIQDDLIADYHALIDWQNQHLVIIGQNPSIGIKINGRHVSNGNLEDGDLIQVGSVEILVNFTAPTLQECERMVGFLFKRRCGRTDRTNCTYCCDGNNNDDPYYYDYAYYGQYNSYSSGNGGSDESELHECSCENNSEAENIDFTEADSVFLEEADCGFELDMGAS
jgi:hypothetical protein